MINQVKEGEPEEGLVKSEFEETIQLIEDRINFFKINHLSNQCDMLKCQGPPARTIAQVFPGIAAYLLHESPIQPALRDLYTSQFDKQQPRCVLPPPSQGEESINEPQQFQPSFLWLSKAIIDSNMLEIDQPQPKKADKTTVPPEWVDKTQIMICNIAKKIHLKSQIKAIQEYFKNTFSRFRWVKIKKVQCIYHKGKPAVLIKFADDKASSFTYFNLCVEHHRKDMFGMQSEVFQVVQNRTKTMREQKWVSVLFRNLPLAYTKQLLVDLLRQRKLNPIWMQELIQIGSFKYTLCKVQYLENAFEICTEFQINPPFKEVKVNLHPKSSKTWESKASEEFLA